MQRADLADAIAPADLTRALVQRIEDALDGYQTKWTRAPGAKRRGRAWQARQQRADQLAADLLGVLPLVDDGDEPLVALLTARRAEWATWARMIPPVERHRPEDGHIAWTCRAVVGALDDAGVPLTLGRNTPVVETLRLVLAWADALTGRAPKRRANSYEFTRAIVNGYRSPK